MKIYNELESLGFFEWLSETHNLKDTDMKPEYLDELLLDDIHRTVCNSMAFRWFREKYNIEPQVKSWKEKGGIVWHYSIQKIGEPSIFRSSDCAVDSHDEAQLICLQKLIQIVKDEKHTRTTN